MNVFYILWRTKIQMWKKIVFFVAKANIFFLEFLELQELLYSHVVVSLNGQELPSYFPFVFVGHPLGEPKLHASF